MLRFGKQIVEKVGAGEERCLWRVKSVPTGRAAPQKPGLGGVTDEEDDGKEDKFEGCWGWGTMESDSMEGGEVGTPSAQH